MAAVRDDRDSMAPGRTTPALILLALAALLLAAPAWAQTGHAKQKNGAGAKPGHAAAKAARPVAKPAHGPARTAVRPALAPTLIKRPVSTATKKAIAGVPPKGTATPPKAPAAPAPHPPGAGAPAPAVSWAGALPMPATSPVKPEAGAATPPQPPADAPKSAADFKTFVHDLWPDAEKRGVSRATFDQAFKGVTYDPATERLTHAGQSEFVTPIWDYLAATVAPLKISQGRLNASKWKATLDRIESDFGMPREVLLSVWGIESGYGAMTGNRGTIRVLATLAFLKYRNSMFRDELLQALQILQSGDVSPARMLGSWAGAMGQTQFMPSSFLHYAVDYDGDGKRDIWNDVPDALASTANFLKSEGWDSDMPWGFEVRLPKDFDASHKEQTTLKPMADWQARGVTRPAGVALPAKGSASLLIPAGLHGPAFLVTPNFKVIKAYNASTSYALGVALLADRIAGKPDLSGTWPVHQKSLGVPQARELQKRLKDLGYDVGDVDGMVGERVRDAILAFEAKTGMPQEGVAVPAILEKVRATR